MTNKTSDQKNVALIDPEAGTIELVKIGQELLDIYNLLGVRHCGFIDLGNFNFVFDDQVMLKVSPETYASMPSYNVDFGGHIERMVGKSMFCKLTPTGKLRDVTPKQLLEVIDRVAFN